MPPSYPPSAIDGGPRAASGFTSMNVTPSKADYTKSTFEDFTDFGSYLNKRDAQRVQFSDVEEGLRKKLIGWD